MKASYRNAEADRQYSEYLNNLGSVPFLFKYDGREYCGFSDEAFSLKSKDTVRTGDKESTTFVFGFTDDIEVTLLLTHYFSHGVTEWTVWFENCGKTNTALLENPHIELMFAGERPVLSGILGDHINQYKPYSIDLTDRLLDFSSDTGRATHINFPYFNLAYGDGGVMLAIGWGGTWNARFSSDGKTTSYNAHSVNGMKTYLKPGEKIRTALYTFGYYNGKGEFYATNYWRDWYVKWNLPKDNASGKELLPFTTFFLANDTGLPNSDGSISERHYTWRPSFQKLIDEKIRVDYRWLDAGWYVRPDGKSEETDWWGTVGTWELDPEKWPEKTFLESTDFAREHGAKTIMWFEPERVTFPELLAENFGYNLDWAIKLDGTNTISNNIGDPACRKWTTDRICKTLKENKVEMYREDNNCNAAMLWKHLDGIEGEGRQGITECKLIDGHYKMWDDIIECTKAYGGCAFVDSCASGGGRNDLESMRRGVPLLRSDSDRQTTGLRLAMTTSFDKWIPFCGAITREKTWQIAKEGVNDIYIWRASYLAILNMEGQVVQDEGQDFELTRFAIAEWEKIAPFMLKDMYVLTPWHGEKDTSDFTVFCYFDSETEKGVLLAFRQEECVRDNITVKLPFISNGENYSLTDADTNEVIYSNGEACIEIDEPRKARVIFLDKLN